MAFAGVRVKNTFLDLDPEDAPPPQPALARSVTAPARGQIAADDEEGSDGEAEDPAACGPDGEDADEAPPPPPQPLYRVTTVNAYEDEENWSWLQQGGDPNQAPEQQDQQDPPPVLQNAAAVPAPFPPQHAAVVPAPMIMVPVAMPGMPAMPPMMPIAVPIGEMPPGWHQMNAFSRWPEGVPPAYTGDGMNAAPEPFPQVDPGSSGYSSNVAPSASSAPPAPPPPSVLKRELSVQSGRYRVNWTVDGRKLTSNDTVAVSPQFEISFFGTDIPFKMSIKPLTTGDGKGGSSFRKAKGKGKIELKCEGAFEDGTPAKMTYRLCIGSISKTGEQKRTPYRPHQGITHDFTQSGVAYLPKVSAQDSSGDEWDFTAVVDAESSTFVVTLEVIPGGCEDQLQ